MKSCWRGEKQENIIGDTEWKQFVVVHVCRRSHNRSRSYETRVGQFSNLNKALTTCNPAYIIVTALIFCRVLLLLLKTNWMRSQITLVLFILISCCESQPKAQCLTSFMHFTLKQLENAAVIEWKSKCWAKLPVWNQRMLLCVDLQGVASLLHLCLSHSLVKRSWQICGVSRHHKTAVIVVLIMFRFRYRSSCGGKKTRTVRKIKRAGNCNRAENTLYCNTNNVKRKVSLEIWLKAVLWKVKRIQWNKYVNKRILLS